MKAKFGRYVFLKKLAIGGMAEIYLARRLSFGGFAKFIVIKRLLPAHRGRKAYERLFLTEARIAALLNHPNIVSLHDLGKLDDAYFMAMEYVHGLSGAELMSKAARQQLPIPLGLALRIVIGVAEALAYCATNADLDGSIFGVIHHDISPHNIQISYNGEVKLLDFGVATQMHRPAPGGRRGKFAYMSPEALRKQPIDPRSDLFSLAVVLYEMTVGRRLFKGQTSAETEQKSLAGIVPLPCSINPHFPKPLEAILFRALDRDPSQRFQSAQEFADALYEVARRLGVDITIEGATEYLQELCGEEIERRRAELYTLAESSTPKKKKRPPTGPLPPASSPKPAPIIEPDQAIQLPSGPDPERLESPAPIPPEIDKTPSKIDEPTPAPTPTPVPDLVAEPSMASEYEPPDPEPEDYEVPEEAHDGDLDWDATTRAPWRRRTALMLTFALALGVVGFFGGQWWATQGHVQKTGTIQFESTPPGARVYDGDNLLGMTPFETEPTALGTVYKVRIELPKYHSWASTISVLPQHPHRSVMIALQPQ